MNFYGFFFFYVLICFCLCSISIFHYVCQLIPNDCVLNLFQFPMNFHLDFIFLYFVFLFIYFSFFSSSSSTFSNFTYGSVFRAGEQGRYWYAVLGGQLEVRYHAPDTESKVSSLTLFSCFVLFFTFTLLFFILSMTNSEHLFGKYNLFLKENVKWKWLRASGKMYKYYYNKYK